MSEPSSLPPILAALDVSFWDEMWESVQDSSQPDLEIYLAQQICDLYPNVTSQASAILEAAVELLNSYGFEIDSNMDCDLPGVIEFIELSSQDSELINEAFKMSDYLFNLNGHDIINFDIPSGFAEEDVDDEFGFSNNEWAYGAFLRDYSDYHDDEVENISLLTPHQMNLFEVIGLIHSKALNPSAEQMKEIRDFQPRLREVYELNNFANGESETSGPEFFERYIKSKWIFVRSLVARSDRASEEHMRQCARDPEPFVRMRLAENPAIPLDLLIDLYTHDVEEVSKIAELPLATHAKTPMEILEKLATSKSKWVRTNVASHPSATPEIKALVALSN